MQTLSYGYFKPETGDRGAVFFPKLELNWARVNSHDHDGTNSKKLPATATDFSLKKSTLLAADWAAGSTLGQGPFFTEPFVQAKTYPSGVTKFTPVHFRDTTTNEIVIPGKVVRGTTALTVTVNDNTLELEAVYG